MQVGWVYAALCLGVASFFLYWAGSLYWRALGHGYQDSGPFVYASAGTLVLLPGLALLGLAAFLTLRRP